MQTLCTLPYVITSFNHQTCPCQLLSLSTLFVMNVIRPALYKVSVNHYWLCNTRVYQPYMECQYTMLIFVRVMNDHTNDVPVITVCVMDKLSLGLILNEGNHKY